MTIANWISTGSALISLGAMSYNVWLTLGARKQDRRNREPFLHADLQYSPPQSDGEFRLSLVIKNCGTNPAMDIEGYVILIPTLDVVPTMDVNPEGPVFPISNPNGLPGGVEYTQPLQWNWRVPRVDIRVHLSCNDKTTGNVCKNEYSFLWGGHTLPDFVMPLWQDRHNRLTDALNPRVLQHCMELKDMSIPVQIDLFKSAMFKQ